MSAEMTVPEMLHDLQTHYQGQLTEWQALFIDNLAEQLENWTALAPESPMPWSVNQVAKVQEIYAEKDEEE